MPEGPEAQHVATFIHGAFAGHRLMDARILMGRYAKHGPPANYREFCEALPLRLERVHKKGKVLLFRFEDDWTIISRLGLMGWWYSPSRAPEWQKPRKNLVFTFDRAEDPLLYYTDLLSYGTLTFTKDPAHVAKVLEKLAPDFMTSPFRDIQARLELPKLERKKDLRIEEALMDQELVMSGVGNYLKAEILYDARISPLRTLGTLTLRDWKSIHKSAQSVARRMSKALERNSLEAYAAQMRVYLKTADPQGRAVAKHRTNDGRTTFWVPAVQV